MIGTSPKMKTVYDLIGKVANTPTVVLILGESGTGKELVAKAIHTNSDRKPHPFIQVNCGAIPSELFESELFGHEKGSFTGAIMSKPGKFELAEKGTLFLDEIGELPKEMQVKLLRVLQDGSYARVGGIQSKQADVRIVAATNRDLQQEVQQGNFREDLFYRLHVLPIKLPALRDRIEDLPELIRHFIERANKKLHKNVQTTLAINDIQTLQSYHWPGNIRELENLVERAVLLTNNSTITIEDFLHPELRNSPELNLKDYVKSQTARLEKQHIVYILETCNGNVTHAAQKLGISRKSLQNKMREYNLRDNS
jgi:transcriptional regulator with PAS, ATPase and Fis domain